MNSKESDEILKHFRSHKLNPTKTIQEIREDFEKLYVPYEIIKKHDIKEIRINNIPSFFIKKEPIKSKKILLFFHGGGFTIGSTKNHLGFCVEISEETSCRILSIDYSLAPENPFPKSLEDCFTAYKWLLNKGYLPNDIIPIGISAGATLVLSLLLLLKKQKLPMPDKAVCMSAATDLTFNGKSVKANEDYDWTTEKRLKSIPKLYLRSEDIKDPLVSPYYADLHGLPSLLIQVGSHELLFDDNCAFSKKAKEQGVKVVFEIYDGMFHCWQMFPEYIPEGRQAIKNINAFIQKA